MMTCCIVALGTSHLLLILPSICPIFFPSILLRMKNFVEYFSRTIQARVLIFGMQVDDDLLSPRTTKLWRGYRVCPVRMYVRSYVRTFVHMFTFYHRSSDLNYHPVSILLHTNIGFDNTLEKFAFQHDRVKIKVAVTFFRKTMSSL